MTATIHIKTGVDISEDDLVFTFSRSSGPGGQNVNKVNTKAAVLFDVANCDSLTDEDKNRILDRLSSRINKEGILRVESGRFRSQAANRDAAVARLVELLRLALMRKPRRKKTRIPQGAKERRIEAKKKRGEIKKMRGKINP